MSRRQRWRSRSTMEPTAPVPTSRSTWRSETTAGRSAESIRARLRVLLPPCPAADHGRFHQRNHQRNRVDSSDLVRHMRQERQERAAQGHWWDRRRRIRQRPCNCQGGGRGFESRRPLQRNPRSGPVGSRPSCMCGAVQTARGPVGVPSGTRRCHRAAHSLGGSLPVARGPGGGYLALGIPRAGMCPAASGGRSVEPVTEEDL
jgi:hypothetical protein